MTDLGGIISNAQGTLVKRTLGGVTEDSANKAIEKAATETDAEAQKKIREAQNAKAAAGQALVEMQNKNSELEKANRTLKDDRDALQGENEKLNKTLASRPRTREGKPSVLPNGNIKTIKTNSNGARMEIERTPDGRTVSYAFENIDGDRRNTTFDPVSKKPVKTFDNTNGEDTLMEYTPDGKVKMTRVNVKKEKAEKPTIISKGVVVNEDWLYHQKTFRDTYSDGSYVDTKKWTNSPDRIERSSYNAQGKITEFVERENWKDNKVRILTTKYDPETGKKASYSTEFRDKTTDKIAHRKAYKYAKDGETKIESEEVYSNGVKKIVKLKVDEYGIYDRQNAEMEFIYPSDSKIKKTKTTFQASCMPVNEIITLRDGSQAIIDVNPNDYHVQKLTINKKGEDPVVTQNSKEIDDYLASIGKIGYDDSLETNEHNEFFEQRYDNYVR